MATEQELGARVGRLEAKINGLLGDSGLTTARPTLSAWNDASPSAFVGEGWGLKEGSGITFGKEANTGLLIVTLASFDSVLTPTGSNDAAVIQAAIDAGHRRILLLDGAWSVGDQVVTFAAGTEIFGQTKAGTILSWGTVNYNSWVLADNCLAGNFTVNTAPTDGGAPVIELGSGRGKAWNIAFSASSGNGIITSSAATAQGLILECEFEGVPDANTGQIWVNSTGFLSIKNCAFLGATAAGSAIYNKQTGSDFFPRSNIVITGCYGTTKCAQGWLDDSDAVRESTIVISGNSVAQMGDAIAIDILNAIALISSNAFVVPTGQSTAASMINVSGGKVMITNNRFDANTTRTDIIDFNDSVGGHTVSGNLIRGTSTNAIHLASTGDNNVVSSNTCPGGDIRIASGSSENIVALNQVNAIIGSATANRIGPNVTGV